MYIIFSVSQNFRLVDVKSLIKAKNGSVKISPKMKSYYDIAYDFSKNAKIIKQFKEEVSATALPLKNLGELKR